MTMIDTFFNDAQDLNDDKKVLPQVQCSYRWLFLCTNVHHLTYVQPVHAVPVLAVNVESFEGPEAVNTISTGYQAVLHTFTERSRKSNVFPLSSGSLQLCSEIVISWFCQNFSNLFKTC